MLGDQERAEGGDRGQRRLDQMIVGGARDHDRDQSDRRIRRQARRRRRRPSVVKAESGPCAFPGSWAAQTRMSVNRTAATPSLNRLSASMRRRSRPVTPDSRSSAMTAIGSVAAISAPKTRRIRAASRARRRARPRPPARRAQRRWSTARPLERDRASNRSSAGSAPPRTGAAAARRRRSGRGSARGPAWTAGGGERRSGQHEADRIGQAQPARRQRDQNREAKKGERAEQQDVHAVLFTGPSAKAEPRGPAIPPPSGRRRRADSARDRPARRRPALRSADAARSSGRSSPSGPRPRPGRRPGLPRPALSTCARIG